MNQQMKHLALAQMGRPGKYTYIHTYMQCMHTYTHIYTRTYIHTHVRTYTHTHMHAYIHTHIHTYIHTLGFVFIDVEVTYKTKNARWSKSERGYKQFTSFSALIDVVSGCNVSALHLKQLLFTTIRIQIKFPISLPSLLLFIL
jgi:hypothetical protein